VSRSAPSAWARLLTLALLGGLGVLASPRPAAAGGCHVAERPVLGLSHPGDLLPDAGFLARDGYVQPPAQVAPRPCTGDEPGGLERANPIGAVALTTGLSVIARPPSRRLIPEPSTVRPIHLPTSLDRPPRPSERS